MHTIDWLLVLIPLCVVSYIGFKAQKYVNSVSDFLAAGRVAGRYVLAVSAGEASFGLISLAAGFEMFYKVGFALSFWNLLYVPVSILITLSGYCVYRFRETRSMTMGQFLEMRYNRAFRIFAGILQSISGVVNYAIFPAVGARFLIYFCDMPLEINVMGAQLPTFALLMAGFLTLAVIIVCLGGQITIMTTDCIQGILSYPFYMIVSAFLIFKFSYSGEMAPALMDRPDGYSMVNPFDIEKLRDFNIFYIVVGILNSTLNRMSWSGTQGYNAAAVNAHEQKMGGVLGTWRVGFSTMMFALLGVVAFTYLNNANYTNEAAKTREHLIAKTFEDSTKGKLENNTQLRNDISHYLQTGELSAPLQSRIDSTILDVNDSSYSAEPVQTNVKSILLSEDPAAAQTFDTIYKQMRVPFALKDILPVGIMGIFCALCIFLLISTDTTYMHSWGSIIVQDIIMPLRGDKPLSPQTHLLYLRLAIIGVALFAFFFSLLFAQVDYIFMFFAITGAIWTGGAGPCIVGGLYWKRATTAAAFTTLILGSSIAVGGIVMQKIWAPSIYPWLVSHNWVSNVNSVLMTLSGPFEPFIKWRVTPDKFPINSQELLLIGLVVSIGSFVGVSLLTCKKPFNMDRLLHRGKYRLPGDPDHKGTPEGPIPLRKLTPGKIVQKFVGINEEYSKGDKALAWSVFVYGVVWLFGSTLIITIWNFISPWPDQWWATWFAILKIYSTGLIGLVSTFWFLIGGIIDLKKMFSRLAVKEIDHSDDGRVIRRHDSDDDDKA
ncbi:sodium:solute symporter family protein [Cerasicoccus frondis]|uniref:sodium:solute symporter family protein n=1 Tax=Cerasicoccus frondis TaxID=490090 RepID=UPI002852C27A|nr:hypothetical protein [Cerasicoccus frondis]